ncbi:MAG TPA: hypothetical protein PKD55_23355, partial [Bellilinea sp.]|nr:hypothetical protein [Bellilinea sp.]
VNLYGYVKNNPINFNDASGLASAQAGAYAGAGADFTIKTATCCSSGNPKEVKYLISCVGFGVGAKLGGKEFPGYIEGASVGIDSFHKKCPKTGDVFLAKELQVGPAQGSVQFGTMGASAEASVGLAWGAAAVPIKGCAIIVLSEESSTSECCK